MTIKENEHFASMRRTPRETLAFALMAAVATLATTTLAVAPASASVTKRDAAPTTVVEVEQAR